MQIAQLRPLSPCSRPTCSLSDTSLVPMRTQRFDVRLGDREVVRRSRVVVGVRSSCSVSSATSRPKRAATPDSFCGSVERPRLPRQRVHDRLPHPPDRVRDELDVAVRIEPARGFHQAEVAFVDQIEERNAQPAIPLGVADDEAQVAFDEPAQRLLIARADARRRARALRRA